MSTTHPLFKKHIQKASRFQLRKPTPKKTNWDKFYKLSSNENMMGASPRAVKALQQAIEGVYEYDFYDDYQFQDVLADFYNQELKSGQFITANSGVEVLEIICRGLVSVGSECIISSPTFSPYKNIIELEGGVVVDVPLNTPDYSYDVDGVLAAVTDKTAIVFVTNPNNPTGTYATKAEFERLLDALPKDVIVVYDEVYFHFVDADDFPYAKDYIKEGRNIIGLHTFSKIYGLAGMRVGYGLTTPEIGEYLNKIFRPFRISTLSTIAAYEALKDTEHVKASQEMVWEGKKWLYDKFQEAGVRYWPSQGNFVMFKSPINSIELTLQMLDEGVMVRPGDNFGAVGCTRMTIGTQEANERFWEVFSTFLNA
ncbi:MAG: aminotransferase class I/II-fold pyridoxal phosphate-dependent enzyme [Flavobacteriales bacterium]|nr:aminotransferase class I/II-fold pyridoxal phosphate-dependent enzyme [Flavobacteriales bacterium]